MAKAKEKEKKYVYVTYDSYSTGGDPYPGQTGSYQDREPTETDVEIKELVLVDEYPMHGDSVAIDFDPEKYIGKPLYLVDVRYTTGDTFGTSHGNVTFPCCFTEKWKADKAEKQIQNGTYGGKGSYQTWQGYFESLESVQVREMILEDRRK